MNLPILLLLVSISTKTEGRVWDLVSAVKTANKSSEKIRQSNAEYEASKEENKASRSRFLPTLDFETRWDKTSEDISTSQKDPVGRRTYHGMLRQRLFSPKSWYLYKKTEAESEAFNLATDDQVYSYQADTVQLYLDLLRLESLMNQLNHSYESIDKEKSRSSRKVDSGILTRMAIDELGVRLSEIALMRNETSRKRDFLKLVFQERLGQSFYGVKPLKKGFDLKSITSLSLEKDLQNLPQRNTKVIKASSDVNLRKIETEKRTSEFLPEVNSFLELSRLSSHSLKDSKQVTAGIELKWTIFSGGGSFHKTLASKKREVAAKHGYREVLIQENLNLKKAAAHLKKCGSRIKHLQDKSRYLNNMVISESKRFRGGISEFSEYIKKKSELQDSQLEITVEKFDCLLAYIKYMRHSGHLNIQTISKISQSWFE